MDQEDFKKTKKEYYECINELYSKAFKNMPFDFICSLLRVSGLQYGHWDPLEELYRAKSDYDGILDYLSSEKNECAEIRIGLLLYCNYIEMTPIHEIIFNLLRCIGGDGFSVSPFKKLYRKSKGNVFKSIPPSAKVKYQEIKNYAKKIGLNSFVNIIDSFYNDKLRNSFVHADYCLDENEYHGNTNMGFVISYAELKIVLIKASIFYDVFLSCNSYYRSQLSKARRFHKWPNYEVFEILKNEHGIYGFKIHYSNGSTSSFERHPLKVEIVNFSFGSEDGKLEFMVGFMDDMKPVWVINGKEVTDFDILNG